MRAFLHLRTACLLFLLLILTILGRGEQTQPARIDRGFPPPALAGSGGYRPTLDGRAALFATASAPDLNLPDEMQAYVGASSVCSVAAGGPQLVVACPGPSPLSLYQTSFPTWPGAAVLLLALLWMGVRQLRCRREIESTRAALNATPSGLLIVDLSGAVVTYNRELEELWGIPKTSHQVGRADALLQVALPQLKDPKEFLATVLRLRADPQARTEDTIEFKDGRVFERHSEPQRIGNHIVGRVWGFRDVTIVRNKGAALEEKARAFRALIDSVPECIYFKDRDSRFTRVNQALARAHGYTDCHDMIGKSDFDSCAEEHAREAYADEQDLVNEVVPIVSKEEKETWPDGRETWVLTTKMPFRDPEGQVIGTFGISRDITERKRMEQSLWERERWLSAVLGSIRDSVIALDSLGIVQWINPSAEHLTGGSCHDFRGKLVEDVVRLEELSDGPVSSESGLMNSLLSGRVSSLERLNATVVKADGSPVPVELTGSVIEVGDNAIAGAVLVLRPIRAPGSEMS